MRYAKPSSAAPKSIPPPLPVRSSRRSAKHQEKRGEVAHLPQLIIPSDTDAYSLHRQDTSDALSRIAATPRGPCGLPTSLHLGIDVERATNLRRTLDAVADFDSVAEEY
ncbi:hypothetical protein CTAM01_14613 [Colletotrichum tamarilloi]|uniref:Uncharacterized protein n=1 Tax=Colletotrichum tamarilloi TaxID=1209934 RepID=A0ABQ9QNR1_9PEZI|nr:uncharacterized protein CTAM01_14613 [Colletotrichum tamarilloi]KAK1479679.1 hypothetical protein CTAM01_14613 [Colletotrichum tamarilloi]